MPEKTEQGYLECERMHIFLILMAAAGFMGAYTYLLRGGVFCNGQTGNVLLLGLALGRADWWRALFLLLPISAYFFGTLFSEIVPDYVKRSLLIRWDTLLLLIETVVLTVLGLLPESAPVLIFQIAINVICAMQYNTFRQAEGIPMSTTFCSNHIRQAGVAIAKWLQKKEHHAARKALRHFAMLGMFVAGAAVGALCCRHFEGRAIWGAAALTAVGFLDLLHEDICGKEGPGTAGRIPYHVTHEQ